MADVTVCVPAYRIGSFVEETLCSVQRQSHANIVVDIGIEPPAEETLVAVAPFLADSRFGITVNASRLGWDGNIRQLLQRVATPYFVILPHDDMLHPDYIGTLLVALQSRPDASVAYGDMFIFGDGSPQFKTLALPPDGAVADRLLAFFLGGAEAVPWRGVTRAEVIAQAGGFPTDNFGGLAVECEWALALLLRGAAIRVPRPLYLKRLHPTDVESASRARLTNYSPAQRAEAFAGHRERMLRPLAAIGTMAPKDKLLHLVAECAMLRRRLWAMQGGDMPDARDEAQAIAAALDELAQADDRARDLRPLIREQLGLDGAHSRGEDVADPTAAAELVRHGQVLLGEGRVLDALDMAAQAFAVAPHCEGIDRLMIDVAAMLTKAYADPGAGATP